MCVYVCVLSLCTLVCVCVCVCVCDCCAPLSVHTHASIHLIACYEWGACQIISRSSLAPGELKESAAERGLYPPIPQLAEGDKRTSPHEIRGEEGVEES